MNGYKIEGKTVFIRMGDEPLPDGFIEFTPSISADVTPKVKIITTLPWLKPCQCGACPGGCVAESKT